MSLLTPLLVLAAAVVVTYLFCVRPMRRGHCPMAQGLGAGLADQAGSSPGLDAELRRARQELAALRERFGRVERSPR